MKNYILFFALSLGLFACQKEEVSVFSSEPYVDLVNVTNSTTGGTQVFYSNFYYKGPSTQNDTIWIRLMTRAAVPQKNSQVNLYSYKDTTSNLQAGTLKATEGLQFESLSSENMKNLLVFHKGHIFDSIPVILKRDASLKGKTYCITLRLGNSADIKAADQRSNIDPKHTYAVIYVSDGLAQPSNWPYYFGTYGQVKHDFMIRHTGDKWDALFINSIDYTQQTYYQYKFYYELIQENADRAVKGLPALAEANGSPVSFYIVGS